VKLAICTVWSLYGALAFAGDAGAPPPRNLPAEFEQLVADGKLPAAGALLDTAGAGKDLAEVESGQLSVLKGVLVVLQSLPKGLPKETCRARADDLQSVEARLAEATAGAELSGAESAQFLALRGLLLTVGGSLRVESGEEDRARASFRKALEINPRARLPGAASAAARRLFDEAKAPARAIGDGGR
jgi:hypothetical protein